MVVMLSQQQDKHFDMWYAKSAIVKQRFVKVLNAL